MGKHLSVKLSTAYLLFNLHLLTDLLLLILVIAIITYLLPLVHLSVKLPTAYLTAEDARCLVTSSGPVSARLLGRDDRWEKLTSHCLSLSHSNSSVLEAALADCIFDRAISAMS